MTSKLSHSHVQAAARRLSYAADKTKKDLFRLTVCSPAFSRHLHTVTGNNRHVPWEHLETDGEQCAFLKGIFDQAEWMNCGSSPGIGIGKIEGYDLLRASKRSFEIHQYEEAFRLARETTHSYTQIAAAIDVPVCSVREERQNLRLYHVNVLVHLNVDVPGIKTSRFSNTCTFTSTFT